MGSLWYDREGKPMSAIENAELRLANEDYKRVALTKTGKETISTVWLGLDHNYTNEGPPIIFETLVFGGKHDSYMERYATESEAKKGHERIVAMVMRDRKWWKRWAITFGRKGR